MIKQDPETREFILCSRRGKEIARAATLEAFQIRETRRSSKRAKTSRTQRPDNWREELIEALKLFPDSSLSDIADLLNKQAGSVNHWLMELEAEGAAVSTVIGGGRFRLIRRWRAR